MLREAWPYLREAGQRQTWRENGLAKWKWCRGRREKARPVLSAERGLNEADPIPLLPLREEENRTAAKTTPLNEEGREGVWPIVCQLHCS
jgi:hypothetical protein